MSQVRLLNKRGGICRVGRVLHDYMIKYENMFAQV